MYSPMLLLHICSGTSGLLSGGAAVFLRKGSRRHALMGSIFAISMMSLSATGAYLGFMKNQTGNVMGGMFTFYMVATGWATARRREGINIVDWVGLLFILALGASEVILGIGAAQSPKGSRDGVPAAMYFIFGFLALLAAIGDIRMLVRGGLEGTRRLARHLWRMCFGLFVASGSIFLARPHLFPVFMRRTGMLVILTFLPLALMVFWLFRVRFAKHPIRADIPDAKSKPVMGTVPQRKTVIA